MHCLNFDKQSTFGTILFTVDDGVESYSFKNIRIGNNKKVLAKAFDKILNQREIFSSQYLSPPPPVCLQKNPLHINVYKFLLNQCFHDRS